MSCNSITGDADVLGRKNGNAETCRSPGSSLKRLKKTLRSVQQVEFYQKQFENAGIATSDIKILEDLQKVPFTKKQDLRDGYPFGFFAVPMRKIVRIHTTSGLPENQLS